MSKGPQRNYSEEKRKSYGRYRVRCRYCRSRRTLTKLPEFYLRPCKCTCAKALKARKEGVSEWSIDWHRTAKFEARATTCTCSGNPHPHRRGSTWKSGRCDHAPAPIEVLPYDDVPF